ncbi:hypothetical protein N7486_011219 [Penicillium sp. IBT 16267x]|nr:hypothetical protein N7486_011219 [Penicillium sp. IBT 16267x]
MDQPPANSFDTEFELDPTAGNTLSSRKIKHDAQNGEVNREKITADRIRNTSFCAKLTTVQYGTYHGPQADGTYRADPAALLIFKFCFDFRSEKRDRFTSVKIVVEFEETLNKDLETPTDRNPRNDPQVKSLAPHRVYGVPTAVGMNRSWSFQGSMGYQVPAGPQLNASTTNQTQESFQRHRRMRIEGDPSSDNEHIQDNKVVWKMQENKMEGSGVLSILPAAVVVVLPKNPEYLVKATVTVTPHLAFSINPLRLRQKHDDPFLLDRKTSWGPQYEPGRDFSDPDYPWSSIITIPTEYQDMLHS